MENQQTKPCENCKLRARYDENPKSLLARFWHWHTKFCPGWKAFYSSLSEKEQIEFKYKYNL